MMIMVIVMMMLFWLLMLTGRVSDADFLWHLFKTNKFILKTYDSKILFLK